MQKQCYVSTVQTQRYKKKPTVTSPLAEARMALSKVGIEPKKGHSYHIFACGHVVDKEDDPFMVKYTKTAAKGIRICPICWEEQKEKIPIITKYKHCICGAEHTGLRVQTSTCCYKCTAQRKALKGATPKGIEQARYEAKTDPARCDCIHRRKCIMKYSEYNHLPCKDCAEYTPASMGEWY